MFSKVKILVPFILLFSVSVGPAEAITGEEIVTKVVNKIKKARDLSVSFEKSFYWKLAGETQRLKGQFYLKKPRKLRLETEEQTVVTDGDTVWTFVPEN
ncbi:MAG: outer membrane lipoprotein carrier protein LolA, partial [Candidatus Latescibacteria bacterium]|nr:outer membrane lipoprotein carrier protein LolA [Candidatus Latescibacterota bacterium]